MVILRRLLLFVVSLSLVGCTSLRPIGTEPNSLTALAAGDRLRVTLRSGNPLNITLGAVEPGLLRGDDNQSGEQVSIALSEVANIERTERDSTKTFFLVAGITVGVVVLIKLIAASHLLGSA